MISMLSAGCGQSQRESGSVSNMPDSFHFMDIGANTVIDSSMRNQLIKALGSEAVDRKSTIYLDLKYKGFLKKTYPDLAELDQKLNINDMVRKEYPATKLTFRYTKETGSLFDFVELIYDNNSGCPLLIKMAVKKEIPSLINTIKEKYGPPQKIPIEDGRGFSLSWRKKSDVFVIARFPGLYKTEPPEYLMMIVYQNRLEHLLSQQAAAEKQPKDQSADHFF